MRRSSAKQPRGQAPSLSASSGPLPDNTHTLPGLSSLSAHLNKVQGCLSPAGQSPSPALPCWLLSPKVAVGSPRILLCALDAWPGAWYTIGLSEWLSEGAGVTYTEQPSYSGPALVDVALKSLQTMTPYNDPEVSECAADLWMRKKPQRSGGRGAKKKEMENTRGRGHRNVQGPSSTYSATGR